MNPELRLLAILFVVLLSVILLGGFLFARIESHNQKESMQASENSNISTNENATLNSTTDNGSLLSFSEGVFFVITILSTIGT